MNKVHPLPERFDPIAHITDPKSRRAYAKLVQRLTLLLQYDELDEAEALLDQHPDIIMGTVELKPLRVAAQLFQPSIAVWAWKCFHSDCSEARGRFRQECLMADSEAAHAFAEYIHKGGKFKDPVARRYQRLQDALRKIYDQPAHPPFRDVKDKRRRKARKR